MNYSVELRRYTEDGDYIEDHYEFETRARAMEFGRLNRRHLYSILDYQGRDCNPIDITPWQIS